MLLLHDEQSVFVDVEVSSVQQRLQRDQTDDLRADHGQLQVLNTTTPRPTQDQLLIQTRQHVAKLKS